MASHLGMSIDRVKMETSASQLVTWMYYLDWRMNTPEKIDYYLAQIALEVRQSFTDLKKHKPKLEDFLLTFKLKEPKEKLPVENQINANRMKNFFFALTGMIGKNKKGKRR